MPIERTVSEIIWCRMTAERSLRIGCGRLSRVGIPVLASLATLSLPFLGGCSLIYDDLSECPKEMELVIEADWRDAPSGNPGGMAYIFYPSDGGYPWRFDFPGRDAGKVSLPPGDYSLICVNDDSKATVLMDEMSFDKAYLRCISAGGSGADAGTYRCPDSIWGASMTDIRISEGGVSYPSPHMRVGRNEPADVITVYPAERTVSVAYILKNMVNLDGVRLMRATLGSMAPFLGLDDFRGRGPEALLTFPGHRISENSAGGDFLCFGPVAGDGNRRNVLTAYFTMADGSVVEKAYDVTRQIVEASDPYDIIICLEGFSLPEQQISGAFDVNVDGWTTIVIDVGK